MKFVKTINNTAFINRGTDILFLLQISFTFNYYFTWLGEFPDSFLLKKWKCLDGKLLHDF